MRVGAVVRRCGGAPVRLCGCAVVRLCGGAAVCRWALLLLLLLLAACWQLGCLLRAATG